MANIYHSDQSFSRNVEKKEKQTEKVRRVGFENKVKKIERVLEPDGFEG